MPRAWINAVYAVVTTTDMVDASGDVIVLCLDYDGGYLNICMW